MAGGNRNTNAQYGGGAGTLTGAALGGVFGGFGGAALGASLGGSFGSLIGGQFGEDNKGPDINIEAIMAQINAKIAAAGEMAKQRVRQQAGQQRRATASNLAGRGVLRSGVSENNFGQIRDSSLQAQAGIDEQVLTQQAGTFQDLFFKGKQLESAQSQRQQQQKAARMGQIGAFAGSLMQAGLAARAGSTTQKLNQLQRVNGGNPNAPFEGFGNGPMQGAQEFPQTSARQFFQQQKSKNAFEFGDFGSNFGRTF